MHNLHRQKHWNVLKGLQSGGSKDIAHVLLVTVLSVVLPALFSAVAPTAESAFPEDLHYIEGIQEGFELLI